MTPRIVAILCMLIALATGLGFALAQAFEPSAQMTGGALSWMPATLALIALLSVGLTRWAGHQRGVALFPALVDSVPDQPRRQPRDNASGNWHEMHRALTQAHGYFWRRKLRVLLVIGEPEEIAAIAPELTEQRWLQVPGAVLMCGDHLREDKARRLTYPGLGRWRAIDGVVWALSRQQTTEISSLVAGLRALRHLSRQVRWQLPLYVWEVCTSPSLQQGRPSQPVGCLFGANAPEDELAAKLDTLQVPLHEVGVAQLIRNADHDFLLRLADHLDAEGTARWRQTLASLRHEWGRGVRLRGLFFSLRFTRHADEPAQSWQADPAWRRVLDDHHAPRVWRGRHPGRLAQIGGTALAAFAALGLVTAFVVERVRIHQVHSTLNALINAPERDQQYAALGELSQQLAALKNGPQRWPHLGFDQTPVLLAAAWPHFVQGTLRLVRDPMAEHLQQHLRRFVQLPANEQSAETTRTAYDQLKAYRMLAQPEKVDPAFLSRTAGQAVGDTTQSLFFAQQLPLNPQWRIAPDPSLIEQVRKRLILQLADRTDEAALYQGLLDSASHHYAPLTLTSLLGTADASSLFNTHASVPGAFTRQAWQEHISDALDALVVARESHTAWVLGELSGPQASEASAPALKQRLTDRYWRDYSQAWQGFLASLRAVPANGLDDATERLALIADPRRSPLRALLQTLAEQGRLAPDDPHMRATFGPLLRVMDNVNAATGQDEHPRWANYVRQVSRLQRTLERVTQHRDPSAAADDLARAFLQGSNPDAAAAPADARSLVQALGGHWRTAGQVLFVQPVDVAWKPVLEPSLANLNHDWQQRIADPWRLAFMHRYPFAATPQDASLSTLASMIRPDAGSIDRFVREALGQVLHKEGDRWVADPRHQQGLRLNPQWLAAVNQLSQLASSVYSDGALSVRFELSGQARAEVMQTRFVLDGKQHEYFNQRPAWQRFSWPGPSPAPGARLSWTAREGGEQLLGNYLGVWGLMRLLEQARVDPIPGSPELQRLVIRAPDGAELTWHLRAANNGGPLALLRLRDFMLPREIFLADAASPLSSASASR